MAFKKLFGRKPKLVSSVPRNNIDNTSSSSSTITTTGCFDCNICLDLVRDPVVTLCGHLFCWPCLYEWLNVQSTSLASDEHPQCPVCKAQVSQSTVVPLYGRGETPNPTGHNQGSKSPSIPARPPAYGTRALLSATPRPMQQLPFQNPHQGVGEQYYPAYDEGVSSSSSSLFNQGNQSATIVHPVLEMFAELIYTHMSRNPSHDLYSLRNSHHRTMNPRLRWQEMRANKFLSRISLFFLCCILLCLVLF